MADTEKREPGEVKAPETTRKARRGARHAIERQELSIQERRREASHEDTELHIGPPPFSIPATADTRVGEAGVIPRGGKHPPEYTVGGGPNPTEEPEKDTGEEAA